MSVEENVYLNLDRVFSSNMEISAPREDRIHSNVGRISIEFDVGDLNLILGTKNKGFAKKELMFNHFLLVNVVRNICRWRDLCDDICHISFYSQLYNPVDSSTSQHSSAYNYS